jgi:hypothetical protein
MLATEMTNKDETDADYDGPCSSSNDDGKKETNSFFQSLNLPSDYFAKTTQNVPSEEDPPVREDSWEDRVTEGRTLRKMIVN